MLPQQMKSKMFDSVSLIPIRYVSDLVRFADAEGLVAQVYEQVAEEFFMNGAFSTHSVRPELLAGLWAGGREVVLTDLTLSRDPKESLGISFAQANRCTYCEDLMIAVIHGKEMHEVASKTRFHQQEDIRDDFLRDLHRWARNYKKLDSEIIRNPPFTAAQAPELLGTALTFNYLNRYVKVFFNGTPLDTPFTSKNLKSAMFRGFGAELRDSVTRVLRPGRAYGLLPEATLPHDLNWAAGNAHVAQGVARWAGAIERIAEPEVSPAVRAVITDAVTNWSGQEMPISRGWTNAMTEGLGAADRAAAKLGLLTALAAYQVTDDVIDDFKAHFDNDGPLVSLVAWSAFTASRRIAGWLADAATVIPFRLPQSRKA